MHVIPVCVGQFGVQFGLELHRQLLSDAGTTISLESFLRPTKDGGLSARTIMIDTEPKTLDEAVSAAESLPFDLPAPLPPASGGAGAGNNWAAGFGLGAAARAAVRAVQREQERVDGPSTVLLLSSFGGGTGSGLGARISYELADLGTSMTSVGVWPASAGEVATQDYNTVLSLASLSETTDTIIAASNDALAAACRARLRLPPTHAHMNTVLARTVSCMALPTKEAAYPLFRLPPCPRPWTPLLTPLRPREDSVFAADSVNALLRRARQLARAGGWCEETCVSVDSSPVSGLWGVARGAEAEVRAEGEIWQNGQSLADGGISLACLSPETSIPHLTRAIDGANTKFSVRAYVHAYERYGLEETELEGALAICERMIN